MAGFAITEAAAEEILNRSVGCAEKRLTSFEKFFWNGERAKDSVRVTPLK